MADTVLVILRVLSPIVLHNILWAYHLCSADEQTITEVGNSWTWLSDEQDHEAATQGQRGCRESRVLLTVLLFKLCCFLGSVFKFYYFETILDLQKICMGGTKSSPIPSNQLSLMLTYWKTMVYPIKWKFTPAECC